MQSFLLDLTQILSLEMYHKVETDCLLANELGAKELSVLPIVVPFTTRQNRHQLDKVVSFQIKAKRNLPEGREENGRLQNVEKTRFSLYIG